MICISLVTWRLTEPALVLVHLDLFGELGTDQFSILGPPRSPFTLELGDRGVVPADKLVLDERFELGEGQGGGGCEGVDEEEGSFHYGLRARLALASTIRRKLGRRGGTYFSTL